MHRYPVQRGIAAVLVVAAVVLSAGCELEACQGEPPTTRTVEPDEVVYFRYREERKPRVTDRADQVPLGQRAAVVLRGPEGKFPKVESEGGREQVWTANLLEESPDRAMTARLRTHEAIAETRRTGRTAVRVAKPVGVRAAEVARRVAADPLLWRIDTEGKPTYLFGTIHLTERGELDDLAPQVQEAFRSSEMFVMETDLEKFRKSFDKPSMLVYPPGQTLKARLTSEQWETLVERVGEDVPPRALRRFRPWVATMRLSNVNRRRSKEVMDVQLRDWAKTLDKEIGFLETPSRQINALRRGFDLEVLRKILDAPEDEMVGYEQILEAYESGDLERIEQVMLHESGTFDPREGGYREVLVERNRDWVPKIEGFIERGGVFVAAGSGHFVGPDSVIVMLRDKGYEVQRVP
jgi:uncharacterized protein YbaP (TraB family)